MPVRVGKVGKSPPVRTGLGPQDKRRAATQIKDILVELAGKNLPRLMGRIYTEVVVSCLTCLDKDNQLFGDEKEFQDEDGIQVGVRYIEKILFELERISV
ncbi:hypothetical protein BDW74DRAFT_172010 [Aspergillus multicolor]|uniref:uncharacterized protein n=1 Tax=Aspergillus multicolor TaxID=41759 RepID=UPI003CCCE567